MLYFVFALLAKETTAEALGGNMLFNSLAFALFLPFVFVIYWTLPHKYRWFLLLIASYYFYMSWNPKYVVLILLTTVISYVSALWIEKSKNTRQKKIALLASLVICLGTLFFFKYFNFFSSSVQRALGFFSIKINPFALKVLLPVGISFYTFQTLSYVIDVYRGKSHAERHFGIYATFISFFPQLVAGPIERTENLLPQIKSEKQFDYESASYGMKLMAWGFLKKLAIADVMAPYVNTVFSSLQSHTGFDILIAIFFFSLQIYCDFSGYSDIAVGASKLLGINLISNFKSPYFSASIKEFWSRWHISLSTWFRDYVYIPLGGNRCKPFRRSANLLITFLVSGLWHGASWTFFAWGGVHALGQLVENMFRKPKNSDNKAKNILSVMMVFLFCTAGWIFFRAQSLRDAIYIFRRIFEAVKSPALFWSSTLGLKKFDFIIMMLPVIILFAHDYFSKNIDVIDWVSGKHKYIRWSVYFVIIWIIYAYMPKNSVSEFVYFQF